MRHNCSSHVYNMEKRRKMGFNRCRQTCRIREIESKSPIADLIVL